ncbi:MAG: response regulator [Alphaproteobacteria bacterium]|nr:response regulator [Alphaproteobacteria bacterium]
MLTTPVTPTSCAWRPPAAALQNILYIDDEMDILEIAKFALEQLGNFKMETCCGGQEALTRAPSLNPDMILLDVMMPGMDGVEVFKALREMPELTHVPIVFMTARVQPMEVLNYLDMGVHGIIPKPFDPMTLPEAVQSLWQSRHSGA